MHTDYKFFLFINSLRPIIIKICKQTPRTPIRAFVSDLILTIFFLILERKSVSQLDKSRNLIDAFAKKPGDFFITAFTRQLLTDDPTEDVNIGAGWK